MGRSARMKSELWNARSDLERQPEREPIPGSDHEDDDESDEFEDDEDEPE